MNRGILYQRFDLPLFFQDREGYLEATAFIVPKDEAYVIIVDSIKEQEWFGNPLPREEGTTEFI